MILRPSSASWAPRAWGLCRSRGRDPAKSAKMAGWLNSNVPGIRVPDVLLQEMQAAAESGREEAVGLDIACRLVRGLPKLCGGLHIMGLGWEDRIPQILRDSGLRS